VIEEESVVLVSTPSSPASQGVRRWGRGTKEEAAEGTEAEVSEAEVSEAEEDGRIPRANGGEHRRWNDTYWTSVWPRREELTDKVTANLLAELGAKPGERILDIGSGGGKLSLAVGAQVGPQGRVMGADLSTALARLARERASQSGSTNVDFALLDAQHDAIPRAPFAAAVSQFGVMFFDDPVAAFANIYRHVVKGGRLVFACWQSMERNPWALGHVLGAYTPPPPTPALGKSQPGPFALGDFGRTAEVLRTAGWEDPRSTGFERSVTVDLSAIFDDGQLVFNGVAQEDLPAARDAVARHLAQFTRRDGRLDVPIAYFIVSARKRSGVDQPA
jgi:SAM-dependent methyltransferase